MILQLAGVIIGIAGWLFHQSALFVLGGLLCLGVIAVGIATGALNPGGRLLCYMTLLVGLLVGLCFSSWWKGILGAAILSEAVELVTLPFFLRWWYSLFSRSYTDSTKEQHKK